MIKSIKFASVPVTDQDKALEFYTKKLGFKVFTDAPFPSAHASTIVETPTGLIAAWFAGTREKHPDVGIWVSRHEGGAWKAPVEVATGAQPDGTRLPCWNPVLFEMPDKTLSLFYKIGPSPQTWSGMLMTKVGR